jgi:trk/ktr system potassium uptake protein
MYVIVTGAGKVGANITRALVRRGYEVTLIESRRDRVQRLEEEFDYRVHLGDATELYVLERAGIQRPPDLVLAVTGDDEDNIVICQLAREKYGVPKVIARVNDPRNQAHFDLLGISPTVCATSDIMAKVEHQMPGIADVIHLLELREENLEIIEVEIDQESPAAGKTIDRLELPAEARLILVSRNGRAEIAIGSTKLEPGDRVMAILQTGKEDEVREVLLSSKSR